MIRAGEGVALPQLRDACPSWPASSSICGDEVACFLSGGCESSLCPLEPRMRGGDRRDLPGRVTVQLRPNADADAISQRS